MLAVALQVALPMAPAARFKLPFACQLQCGMESREHKPRGSVIATSHGVCLFIYLPWLFFCLPLWCCCTNMRDRGYFDLEKADVPSPMPVLMRRPEWTPRLVSGTRLKPANHSP